MSERIELAYGRIAEIPTEALAPQPFRDYFERVAGFLLSVKKDADNTKLYEDILPDRYDVSYANPDYAASKLGPDFGPILSAIYAELRGVIPSVFEGDESGTASFYELFLEIYGNFTGEELPRPETIRNIMRSYCEDYLPDFMAERVRTQVDPSDNFAVRIIMNADLTGTDYLYEFGEYISPDTIASAEYINSLPEKKVRHMAHIFAEGYRLGFIQMRIDLSKKRTVEIVYELGFERMVRYAIEEFAKMGLSPTIVRAPVRLVSKSSNRKNGYTGAIPNMQFDYDHRNDIALFLDDEYVSKRLRAMQEAYEEVKDLAGVYAGPAVIETFGDEPFVPRKCEHAVTLSRYQQEKLTYMRNEGVKISNRYIPGDERSFTIIDFPVPAIGENYREIFDEVIKINTMDNDRYRQIQQILVDALNEGHAVRVRGANGNPTDLMVCLHELDDPETQSIFENCVADVNIPVGEVFTTPKLEGTRGTLFVSRVFLEGFEFRDLSITLDNGMITDYSCGNFADPDENRAYIEDKILFHHDTLPIGEFAIGTNTLAYVCGRKYGIEDKLPILIAEKTGPHFAMGDTCYSWSEDKPVYNPDGKEIIARDNSVSILRKTDISKAYFGCHTDITIPYSELGSIEILKRGGGTITVIENGRFVLPGTLELNIPLDEFDE